MDKIDVKLVAVAKKGDDDAFSKIYAAIYKDMYKYAYYMLGEVGEAEDIVSETVMVMYEDLSKLKNDDLFSSWAFKILSNKCKMRRKAFVNKSFEIDENTVSKGENEIKSIEQKLDIENAFAVLENDERDVVSLAIFGGYKSNEIANILDLKSGTVRSKLSRALKKMQVKLELQI